MALLTLKALQTISVVRRASPASLFRFKTIEMSSTSSENSAKLPVIIRSCDKECITPSEGVVTGKVPDWLEGALIRNGPGLFEVGPDKYEHWFDGLALLHRFEIQRGGKVTYQNRFLNSTTYQRNMKAQRIVVTEFGTAGHPDPCMTIFQRFKSLFITSDGTDNDNVNVMKIGDGLYASTETAIINRIDEKTLETTDKVKLTDLLAVNTATAHPHYSEDGAHINMASAYGAKPAYCFVQFPNKGENSLKEGAVVGRIPIQRPTAPSYYHSFGLTENYVVFVEQSLTINIPMVLWRRLWGKAFSDSLTWNPQQLVRFHILRRSNGELLKTHLVADPFLVFHHANAFESDDGQEVVVDLCCYKDDGIIKDVYVKELRNRDESCGPMQDVMNQIENKTFRFVLPLKDITKEQVESGANLVTLPGSRATATARPDGSIFCTPENLSEDLTVMEMPQINYEAVNGKKYKYIYGVGATKTQKGLAKVDVEKRSSVLWSEAGVSASEPVFVPRPDATEEDDGVLLSSLLTEKDKNKVSLLVLDASTMKEVARAEFQSPGVIPSDLHGMFFKS